MSLLDQMEQEGWNEFNQLVEKEVKTTTFESSNHVFSEEDFENVTNLPAIMMDLTIFELVSRYGGPMQLEKWATVLSKLSTTMERNQKLQERRNELIEKDFVLSNVKKYLDIFMESEFDAIESQQKIITALYKTDIKTAEFKTVEMRKKALTKISKETKKSIKDSIDRLRKKYEDSDS